ncbi:unnamed protein product [Protopolystoma xenopodis]|uniref:Uncharacterized protein n=1 Tax=Protopolystoma xenopodis TaxID=117903 RepID=A0A448XNT2_9PLAT|nr:unnamed protein product [Protopolystoma xenopodis]
MVSFTYSLCHKIVSFIRTFKTSVSLQFESVLHVGSATVCNVIHAPGEDIPCVLQIIYDQTQAVARLVAMVAYIGGGIKNGHATPILKPATLSRYRAQILHTIPYIYTIFF